MENYDNGYLYLRRWVKLKIKHHWKENWRRGIRFEDTIQNSAQRDEEMEKTKQKNEELGKSK